MGYQKNTWTIYDATVPDKLQPDSFITKDKLDHIEGGIEGAITDFKIGTVNKGYNATCEIVTDDEDPTVKRINITIPKESSWLYYEYELYDKTITPIESYPGDFIIDSIGNVFEVFEDSDGNYRLNKKLNIIGATGDQGPQGEPGPQGPQGIQGPRGYKGEQGENGKSAYEYWLTIEGNEGKSEAEYLESIKTAQVYWIDYGKL